MSEAATEATATAQEQGAEQEAASAEETVDWKAEARKWEQRAKENKTAAAELEKQRKASMSEAEKAVAEAEQRGRTTAASDFGKRLARSEIRATAADASADLEGVFDYLDLGRFVGEDGEPDAKAIKAFVDGLPKKATTPSFDGGTRGTARAGGDMNQLIRRAAGHAG
jgi:membrane protein involved in colicin uptake